MSSIDVQRYKNLREEFLKVCKRVLKENLTTNQTKHREYLNDLVLAYNEIISYVAGFYDTLDASSKDNFRENWIYFGEKVSAVYKKLNVSLGVPRELFTLLLIDDILQNYDENNTPCTAQSTFSDSKTNSISTELKPETVQATSSKSNILNSQQPISSPTRKQIRNRATQTVLHSSGSQSDLSDTETFYELENFFETNMAITKLEFLSLASRTINHNYDGNPLGLEAFINSVELLKEFSNNDVATTFLRFVKSKLEGKALESISAQADSVDEIIAALRQQIQPDNSKVVAGRLLALKPDRSKLVEFTEQAEKLAEALQRSLIIEGMSQAKAREMSIEKTVEVCRGAARSDLVKSVLASTKFESPKEVIAKYVVESSTEEREKQILAFKSYQKHNKRTGRYNNNGGRGRYNNDDRGRQNNNGRGRNGRFGNGGRNNYNNGNNRNFNNGGNNYGNNGRGRNNFGNNGGYRSNNDNNRNVRYAENCDAPQVQLGEVQNRN